MPYPPPPPLPPPPPSSFPTTIPYPPTTPHPTPQPPATPPSTQHHLSDPEALPPPPPHEAATSPYPTNSTTTTTTTTGYDNNNNNNSADTKPSGSRGRGCASDGASSPPLSLPLPAGLPYTSEQQQQQQQAPASSTLRADWLAARAPEHYRGFGERQRVGGGVVSPPPPPPPLGHHEEPGWYREWEGREKERERRRVCGLRPGVFWCVVLLLVLVLGGAVGGGVGGGLAAAGAEDEQSSTASTPTIASSSTTTLGDSASPTASNQDSIGCPSRTGQYYTTTNGSLTFLQLCGINICPETCDIVSASKQRLDTFEECMDACAVYNRQIGTQKCVAVAWDYQQVRQSFDMLCWLKLSQAPFARDDPQDGLTIGAVVVQS
ncbi:uncharacterized protein BKCO1_2000043 [Diplodia corticola]|uniref:Uncharacterized protein n=1 Tax=Diplodia corticola TaxID=236234 RepID=A0A1J9R0L1_9PEZI|nr:uncharacterized protein BKCO1_2000043 [Diplodia corticola]OJD34902.1 hypothetical protein BKCO1_2000043 [Diplodia corticola]